MFNGKQYKIEKRIESEEKGSVEASTHHYSLSSPKDEDVYDNPHSEIIECLTQLKQSPLLYKIHYVYILISIIIKQYKSI